ncbi:MAG: hypothetical protein ICV83_04805 [Cytophagales bacterium]|nr:hypothetical protein [Cytophagales bacterium]
MKKALAQLPVYIAEILRSAALAPSGHNTQPWKFSYREGVIRIFPDFTRRLPVADPDDRELYISLGCALENLLVAACHFGYQPAGSLFPPDEANPCIRVALHLPASGYRHATLPTAGQGLYAALSLRHSNRSRYRSEALKSEDVEMLQSLPTEEGIAPLLLTGPDAVAGMWPFIRQGITSQMQDQAFKRELIGWMRFNKSEANRRRDGLTYEALGFPAMPGWIGKFIVKAALTPDKQCRQEEPKVKSAPALMLMSSLPNRNAWVGVGRYFERFALQATLLGLSVAHLNQPVEVPAVAAQLRTAYGLGDYHPALLVRIGYADPAQPAPRRPLEDLLIQ